MVGCRRGAAARREEGGCIFGGSGELMASSASWSEVELLAEEGIRYSIRTAATMNERVGINFVVRSLDLVAGVLDSPTACVDRAAAWVELGTARVRDEIGRERPWIGGWTEIGHAYRFVHLAVAIRRNSGIT